jgi:Heparinase II/III-like protein/Heparinase II/III N-terminus
VTQAVSLRTSRLAWYGRRLRQMTPAEVGWRVGDRLRQEAWTRRHRKPAPGRQAAAPGSRDLRPPPGTSRSRPVPAFPPGVDLRQLSHQGREALLGAAEGILQGRFEVLGTIRTDMANPTWSLDPTSGQRFPPDRCAFRIDYRDPEDDRNVKQVWELSRLHHLTVLAAAWRLNGDDRYTSAISRHLWSWWDANPVLCGVNWSSGIELGIRLVSWVWIRRLLDGWSGAPALFEDNRVFATQLYWHQRYLATFPSRGSSANNHVIAEAAGQVTASCAFPWFAESQRWRSDAAALLHRELERNTFPEGVNREQAFDYHGLVAELGVVAAAEAEAAGEPLDPAVWATLCQMVDVVAATLDVVGGAPRYGDGDDGRALVVTDPRANRWQSLLAVGAAVFGPAPWWPPTQADMQSCLLGGLVRRIVHDGPRPTQRPAHFANAGLTILRSPTGGGNGEELWCRCDGGPHGFLSIGAHGHADALSIELRHDGVEILSDPGTFRYQGSPAWRSYFRSTIAHNTVELDGEDQSVPGGPFMWTRQAQGTTLDVSTAGPVQHWTAEHDGYARLEAPARHRRTVTLDADDRRVVIDDVVHSDGPHQLRMAYHLGPSVRVELHGCRAELSWAAADRSRVRAVLTLPQELQWRLYRGNADPALGWYSPSFGIKVPSSTLVGHGRMATATLRTEVRVHPPD